MKRILKKISIAAFIAAIFGIFYYLLSLQYPFHWNIVPTRYMKLYILGLGMTLQISAVSMIVSFLIGVVGGIMKVSKSETLRDLATVYVTFFRNIPLLVVILLVYYGVGTVFNFSRFWAAVIALSTFEGAYMIEIIRAGIQSIPKEQFETAEALGLLPRERFFDIILPQAFRNSLPAMTGQFISLVKDSSLASIIAINELTQRGNQVATMALASFESYITVAVCIFR
jgi:polar amino acid transport system permease protein